MPVDYSYDDVIISGVVGKPEIARSNRANQLFFVNKRYIKDKTISAAVEQAFKGLIPIGKFGFTIINIQINPSKVDVNVHPAKLEVRFEEENKIFQAVFHSIKDTLLKGELVADTDNSVRDEELQSKGLYDFRKLETQKIEKYTNEESKIKTNVGQGGPINTQDVLDKLKVIKENSSLETNNKEDLKKEDIINQNLEINKLAEENLEFKNGIEENKANQDDQINTKNQQDFDEMYQKLFKADISSNNKSDEEIGSINTIDLTKSNISIFNDNLDNKPEYKFIGIVFNTYIILEIDKEMYILDQHAAHERILYEKVKSNYYSEASKDSQLLLLPDIITLTHKEMDIAKENIDMFEKAGFMLEEFGENTIKLTGVPTICLDIDNKELFLETLDEINTVARTAKQEKEERFIATVACKAAVKANMVLGKEEVENLMEQLLVLPNPFTCPHGRPTAIKMSKYEIERKFARK